jgi:hypothetical protein
LDIAIDVAFRYLRTYSLTKCERIAKKCKTISWRHLLAIKNVNKKDYIIIAEALKRRGVKISSKGRKRVALEVAICCVLKILLRELAKELKEEVPEIYSA